MSLLSTTDVCRITGGHLLSGRHQPLGAVSIDSRSVKPGEVFLCLRGPRFDGHDYAEMAVERGAEVIIAARAGVGRLPASVRQSNVTVVAVPDPQMALSRMGAVARARFAGPVVGVTGSSGKTSTKEMIAAVLRASSPDGVLATWGNHNNHLGVPLTLLRLTAHHRFAVVEMGISGPGEMEALAEVARPDVGVITTVGAAHLEALGSVAGVARAKGALFDALPSDGLAVMPSSVAYPWLVTRALKAALLTVGQRVDDAVRLSAPRYGDEGARGEVSVGEVTRSLKLRQPGLYALDNALLAIAVGGALGVPLGAATAALARVPAAGLRGEIRPLTGRGRALVDCYNANPQSMGAAFAAFEAMARGRRRVWVLGDMLELGAEAVAAHRALGGAVARSAAGATLLAVGALGEELAAGAREAGMTDVLHAVDADAARARLSELAHPDAWVLIKGSRGVALERVLDALPLNAGEQEV